MKRPYELNIVIIIAIIFGIFAIISSAYYISIEKSLAESVNNNYLQYLIIFFYVSMIIGIIQLVVAYGLYKGILWAWYLAVIGCSIYLLSSLISTVLIFPDVFGIVINFGCLFLLNRQNVKQFFKK